MRTVTPPALSCTREELLSSSSAKLLREAFAEQDCREAGEVHSTPAYHILGVPHAPEQVAITEEMAQRLERAAERSGLQLCVLDGLRTRRLQQALAVADPEAAAEGYVAGPGASRHESGEAVDITLLHRGRPLMLGSGFDQFTAASWRDAATSEEVRELRSRLDRAMSSCGLQGHPKEWWHYSIDGR